MKKAVIMMFAVLTLSACIQYNINEILLEQTEVSLSLRGKTHYTFKPASGQMAFNSEGTLYRFMNDDMNSWFELKCQSRPGGLGEKVVADLKWKCKESSGDEKDLEFAIKQIDGEGMIWMWNSTNNIGLIIRDFD